MPRASRIKQTGPYEIVFKLVLRRLQVGEKVRVGDWCCDPRVAKPVEITYRNRPEFPITESHHPHYRIEIKQFVSQVSLHLIKNMEVSE